MNGSIGYSKAKEQSRFKGDALYKKASNTSEQPARATQKPAKSLSKTSSKPFVFSDYRHFIDKQKRITQDLQKEKQDLNKSQGIL